MKGTKEVAVGKILFSNDGVHPITDGGNLYASAIARGLEKIRKENSASQVHMLPEPLFGSEWEEAEMYILHRLLLLIIHGKRLIHQ